MPLPRTIPTRLLEACDRETKACFTQPSLGLAGLYKSNGVWKIHPYPVMPGETVTSYQINIMNTPTQYEPGTTGVNDTLHDVEFDFHFPVNELQFPVGVGANSHLDHIGALRRWLLRGGTWAARIGTVLKSSPIEDPDVPAEETNRELAHLVRFQWALPRLAPGKAAIVVPVLVTFQTREDAEGDVK